MMLSSEQQLARFQSGADFVAAKAELDRHREKMPDWTKFLIIDDCRSDAAVLRGVLHSWLGYDIDVQVEASMGTAMDRLKCELPNVIFLDHLLPPQNDSAKVFPYLRAVGYEGPIVVISGMVSQPKRRELVKAGAFDVLHKDDMNSMSVGEILLRIAGLNYDH